MGQRMSGFMAVTPPSEALYGALGATNTTSDLYTIDPVTGAGTSIGAIGDALTGLAFRPSDGVLFGAVSNNSSANPGCLITVDPTTGAGTLVGSYGLFGNTIADITFRSDDVLFGWGSVSHRLYTINQSTGVVTQVSLASPFGSFGGGLAFDSADVLSSYSNGTDGNWYLVDSTTAVATSQGALSGYGVSDAIAAAACDASDVTWATVQFSSIRTDLVTIASSTVTLVAETETGLDALAWNF